VSRHTHTVGILARKFVNKYYAKRSNYIEHRNALTFKTDEYEERCDTSLLQTVCVDSAVAQGRLRPNDVHSPSLKYPPTTSHHITNITRRGRRPIANFAA
jgi:hypothetical protein